MGDISFHREVKNRIGGVDILRPLYLMFAAFYHLGTYAFYGHDDVVSTIVQQQPLMQYFVWPVYQGMSIMGHWLTAVTCFLIGWRQQEGRFYKWMYFVLLIGTVLAFATDDTFIETGMLPWDLFPTLIIGMMTAQFIYLVFGQRSGVWLFLGSMILMASPFELLINKLSFGVFWDVIFFGECAAGNLCYWPLIPWMFFIWAAYGLGLYFKNHDMGDFKKSALILLAFVCLGTFFAGSPVSEASHLTLTNWGPFVFENSRDRFLFWFSLHLFVLIALSLEPIKAFFRPLAARMGRLAVNRYFWLAYLIQGTNSYYLAKYLRVEFTEHPALFTAVVLLHIPFVELEVRLLTGLLSRRRRSAT